MPLPGAPVLGVMEEERERACCGTAIVPASEVAARERRVTLALSPLSRMSPKCGIQVSTSTRGPTSGLLKCRKCAMVPATFWAAPAILPSQLLMVPTMLLIMSVIQAAARPGSEDRAETM